MLRTTRGWLGFWLTATLPLTVALLALAIVLFHIAGNTELVLLDNGNAPESRIRLLGIGLVILLSTSEGLADIVCSDPELARQRSRWVNSGDTCTIECLTNLWWNRINGQPAATAGFTFKTGDTSNSCPVLAWSSELKRWVIDSTI
jgi:hypothetical protein